MTPFVRKNQNLVIVAAAVGVSLLLTLIGIVLVAVGENDTKSPNSSNEDYIYCAASTFPQGACTFEYNPVCGDDDVTYGNACGACSDGFVTSYKMGECDMYEF